MSMDPDGTHRIIQQQIKEWHGHVDESRRAKLARTQPGRSPFAVLSPSGRALNAAISRAASFRSRSADASVAATQTAKGTTSR